RGIVAGVLEFGGAEVVRHGHSFGGTCTPATRASRIFPACPAAHSSSAVLPIPASPLSTSTTLSPSRTAAGTPSTAAVSAARSSNALIAQPSRPPAATSRATPARPPTRKRRRNIITHTPAQQPENGLRQADRLRYLRLNGDEGSGHGWRRAPGAGARVRTGSQHAPVDHTIIGNDQRFRYRDRWNTCPPRLARICTLERREYERASLPGASYRPPLRTALASVRSVTDMAQYERHRDQRRRYENPRGYGSPRHPDCPALAAALPGAPAASARATRLPPDPVGMLTGGHLLTPRQPVEYR